MLLALGVYIHFAKSDATVTPQEIDGRVGGNARQPVCGFLLVLELFLPLQSFDESLLREILGVRYVSYDAVDLEKDPPQIVGNKPVLPLCGRRRRGQ
jgi:hypothetical protein